ncbi:Hypothetical predicted protein, partial [Marmota monax]
MGSEGHQDIDLAILTALLKGDGYDEYSPSLSKPLPFLILSPPVPLTEFQGTTGSYMNPESSEQ